MKPNPNTKNYYKQYNPRAREELFTPLKQQNYKKRQVFKLYPRYDPNGSKTIE